MKENKHKRLDKFYTPYYLPGLDGLRSIAVLAIIIYHLNAKWLSGGFLGVDTFFVISGYLITSLLLSEYHQNQSINLIDFWMKRIKRLIPAVIFLVTVVLVFTLFFKPNLIIGIKQDAIAAIFYVSNWWYIFQDVDYFNQFAIEPLKHLWSLSIEEQFYIFFPIILLLLLKKIKIDSIVFILIITSLLSLISMIIIYSITGDSSRVYFGTGTRAQTLLLGCLLAFLWPPFALKKRVSKGMKSVVDISGILGLLFLVCIVIAVDDQDKWIYGGGFYVISFITLFVIASAVHPASLIKNILSFRPFIYIGKRSYSLYLWHFPIIVFINSYYVQGQIPWYVYIIEVLLMFIMAEISYKFIERPVRKRGLKAFTISPQELRKFSRTTVIVLLLIPTLFILFGSYDNLGKNHVKKEKTQKTSFKSKKINPKLEETHNGDKEFKAEEASPLLVGDSIMVDIGNVFNEKVPNANIDGKVGRQLIEGSQLIDDKYQSYTEKNKNVVIELGTNGEFTEDQINELIDHLGKADIYLVNVRVPKDYEKNNNKLMAKAAKEYKNVHLIDWYEASKGHQEYFAYDGIHLEYKGVKMLSNLIIKKMEEVNNKK